MHTTQHITRTYNEKNSYKPKTKKKNKYSIMKKPNQPMFNPFGGRTLFTNDIFDPYIRRSKSNGS